MMCSSAAGAYQQWADQVGDQSYTFENLLPYFKKSLAFEPPTPGVRPQNATPSYPQDAFTSSGGPLKVTYPNFSTSFASWVKVALQQLGLADVNGFLGGNIMGYSYSPMTLDRDTQTRDSSETSFLRQALASETNLNFYPQTLARQILFDSDKKATGVLVDAMGSVYQLNVSKEVIVSAGTVSIVYSIRPFYALEANSSGLVPFTSTTHGIWCWSEENASPK